MVTTIQLTEAFQEASNILAHEMSVTAEFSPFRDMKVKWTRTYDMASFSVSDYLKDAPIEVIKGIAKTIISKIANAENDHYPKETEEWLTSEEFRELNQETYIERSRTISDADTTRLEDSYQRLVDGGLIRPIEDLRLFWTDEDRSDSGPGQSSNLMRVVIMNGRLNSSDVPDNVLDFCLLKQLANINVDFGTEVLERKKEVETMINMFPRADEARLWLEDADMEA